MPSLPSRNKNLTVAPENSNKSVVELTIESPMILDFVNLWQIFCDKYCRLNMSRLYFNMIKMICQNISLLNQKWQTAKIYQNYLPWFPFDIGSTTGTVLFEILFEKFPKVLHKLKKTDKDLARWLETNQFLFEDLKGKISLRLKSLGIYN